MRLLRAEVVQGLELLTAVLQGPGLFVAEVDQGLGLLAAAVVQGLGLFVAEVDQGPGLFAAEAMEGLCLLAAYEQIAASPSTAQGSLRYTT